MNYKRLLSIPLMIFMLGSCVICERTTVIFRNCTKDTLIIGVSNYDNIDSVHSIMNIDNVPSDSSIDIQGISLWEKCESMINKEAVIYPDSPCVIDEACLFQDVDTCYFFLIKLADVRKNSLKQIHDGKLYKRWYTTKKSDYKYDREIKYIYNKNFYEK